ncbi:MAG: hypothetical protein BWY78_00937 [Alphaproteobacteria bacterium ADurb.Bin438]|nr:MAG: hypothetical protein BWY78_00937 [Alphaproteobacteria bacterium ADurb.Bin438]
MQGMAKGLGPKLSYSLVRWDVSNTIKSEDKPFNRFQELKHKSSKNITRPSAGDEIKNAEKERVNSLPLPNKALEYAKMAGKER